MNIQPGPNKKFLAAIVLISIFALIAQLCLSIQNRPHSVSLTEAVIRYFSFFTIESNILVSLCCCAVLLAPVSAWGRFFYKSNTQSAVAVYIFVVGLVYNTVLRQIWNPTGLQKLVDELLHVGVPVLFVMYWFFYVPKDTLKWNITLWLIFPTAYAVYSFIRGAFTGYYPYPFMDVNKLGTQTVILNTCGLVLGFMVVCLLAVAIGKFIAPKNIPG
ncbi:Pr6Pr family membrane protein [Mucilaginibacter sp. HMF5004]|uniref:Pr6Pr family membrane protein n=1 Tax=Mucilaginibacter rivuli TaxID=2857527 RepID=UPI001C6017B0|nr:Pr6Pr family membrane protein [Mucilaginibacter rivuli]MBW4889783.1 Pr6Pr family membrane protein [Mucilaginibacter rivuli]